MGMFGQSKSDYIKDMEKKYRNLKTEYEKLKKDFNDIESENRCLKEKLEQLDFDSNEIDNIAKQKLKEESEKHKKEIERLTSEEAVAKRQEEQKNKRAYEFKSYGKFYVEINNDLITITSRGFVNYENRGGNSSKTIKIENISAVELKTSGVGARYIQFIIKGSSEVRNGSKGAIKDENSIPFYSQQEIAYAMQIKDYIDNYKPKTNVQSQTIIHQNNSSVADEILKFKNLVDIGVITEDEFDKKKKELLNA